MKVHPVRYRLLNSYSGRVIATANRLSDFKKVIGPDLAHKYTIHDQEAGWFASAQLAFPGEVAAGAKLRGAR